jgi:hypothetical protein
MAIEEHLSGKSSTYKSELRSKTKSGAWRWVSSRGRIVERDEKGLPLRAAGTVSGHYR